jgi:hypothetical protein
VEDTAWLHGMDITQTERMLLAGLRKAEEWRGGRLKAEPMQADYDGPEPEPYRPLRRPAA